MADRRGIDDVYDVLTAAERDLQREYDLYPPYEPPRLPQPKGKPIKESEYVPPHDMAGRIVARQSSVGRQIRSLSSNERRSQLIAIGMPEDISLVPCNRLRSALGMLQTGGGFGFKARSDLAAQAKVDLHYEIKSEINRRCVPRSAGRR